MDKEKVKYIVFDIESIPDSKLIKMVKYPDQDINELDAVRKFQEEILTNSGGATFFIPVTFQYPISICIATVAEDFNLIDIELLDEPEFRTKEMVRLFWEYFEKSYKDLSLVTFNGRGFDMPLLELMAYRYGITAQKHLRDKFGSRYRFGTKHIDLQDWLSNFNAIRMNGGLNLLAKLIGRPGKMSAKGDDVYDMFLEGQLTEINNYCIHDVLDTYFIFLRTRVMLGELSITREQEIVEKAKHFLLKDKERESVFGKYLENWDKWEPWP